MDGGGNTVPIFQSEADMQERRRLTFMACSLDNPLTTPFDIGKPYVQPNSPPKPNQAWTWVMTCTLKGHADLEQFLKQMDDQALKMADERKKNLFGKEMKSIQHVEGAQKKSLVALGKIYDRKDKDLPKNQRKFTPTDNNFSFNIFTEHPENRFGPTILHKGEWVDDPKTGKKKPVIHLNQGKFSDITKGCHVVPILTTLGTWFVSDSWANKLTAKEMIIFPAPPEEKQGSLLDFTDTEAVVFEQPQADDDHLPPPPPPPPPSSPPQSQPEQQPQQEQEVQQQQQQSRQEDTGAAAEPVLVSEALDVPTASTGFPDTDTTHPVAAGPKRKLNFEEPGPPALLKAPRKSRNALLAFTQEGCAGSSAFEMMHDGKR